MKYEIDGIEFIDERLYLLYRDGREVMLNRQEYRIHMIFQYLNFNPPIYPWQWDYENYSGKNKDMIGFYYPEDLPVIMQLAVWNSEHQRDEAALHSAGKK